MPVLTPTKADGATAKPNEVLYVDPACQVTDDLLAEQMSVGGMNAVVVADLLSGMLAHERCGVHLYRTVAARSNNPMLKRRYETFGEETLHHVEVLEQLITTLGGNPNYVSPNARAVHGMDSNLVESTFMLNGALDVMTREMAMLDAVFLAESMDHANWQLLAAARRQHGRRRSRHAVASPSSRSKAKRTSTSSGREPQRPASSRSKRPAARPRQSASRPKSSSRVSRTG